MIKLFWDEIVNTPILVYQFKRGWTWSDFDDVKVRADTLLESSSIVIPLIFDLREAPDMPPGMIMQTYKVAQSRHPNGSPVILVGASRVVHTTYTIVQRMTRTISGSLLSDVFFVREWDEIIPCIREVAPNQLIP